MSEDLNATPGPWTKAGDELDVSVDIEGDDGLEATAWVAIWNPAEPEMVVVVVDLNQRNTWDDELLDANVHLTSAAPDLYAALEAVELARHTDAPSDWKRATDLSDAALAKARGQKLAA